MRQGPVMLGIGFAAGLLVGWLVAWWLAPVTPAGPELGLDTLATDGVARDAAPALEARGREDAPIRKRAAGGPDDEPAPGPAPSAPLRPPAGVTLPPGVAGWIEVTVLPPPGVEEVHAEVYVLTAGAPGVDDIETVPYSSVDSDEPTRIAVDRPGFYDVGAVWASAFELETDVEVRTGQTTRITLQIPPVRRVHVRMVDPLPTLEEGWSAAPRVHVSLVGEGGSAAFPGRGQLPDHAWTATFPRGSGSVGRLPPGSRGRVHTSLWRFRTKPKAEWRLDTSHYLIPSKMEVMGGDELQLRVVRSGALLLRVGLEPAGWPVGVARDVTLDLEHAGGRSRVFVQAVRDADTDVATIHTQELALPPGPVRARWHGREVHRGSAGPVDVRAGETTELRVAFSTSARPAHSGRPLTLEVDWPPGVDEDEDMEVAGVVHWPGQDPEAQSWTVTRGEEQAQDAWIRRIPKLIGIIGRAWATEPAAMPRGDTLRLRPVRGGLVVLVPEVNRPRTMGRFVIRRADGLPLHQLDEGYGAHFEVRTGMTLGPFPPGEIVFHLWRGTRRLPDARVTVRAGRTVSLPLPD